eukprot:g4366.t1
MKATILVDCHLYSMLDCRKRLRALATDAAGQLDILGHDGHTLGMNGAQVGVLEERDEVGFGCLLQSKDGGSLEAKIVLEILGNLADQALEGKLSDQQIGRLLVAANLTQSDGPRAVPVRLLDTTSGGGRLTGSLGSQLLARSFASSRLTCGLFSTSHLDCKLVSYPILPFSTLWTCPMSRVTKEKYLEGGTMFLLFLVMVSFQSGLAQMNDKLRSDIVNEHNRLRRGIKAANMLKMEYDADRLEKVAQNYLAEIAGQGFSHNAGRTTDYTALGGT